MNALVKLTVSALFVFVSIVGLEAQTIDANGTLTFPLGTKSIQSKAYRENLDIKDIEFPTTLEGIGSYAFEYCAYIDADLVLPDGLKTVGKEAFYRCINTRRITVPASVTSIGDYAFSKNTSLVVVENSYAHQWAVDNGYDFQFSPEGMPNGVSEVFTAPFLKTSWGQREGKEQFTEDRQLINCMRVAFNQMVYPYGLTYQGSKSYATDKRVYIADFDAEKPNLNDIPRICTPNATDAQMRDYDLYLWQQAIVSEYGWIGSKVSQTKDVQDLWTEHMPVKETTIYRKLTEADTTQWYKTDEEIEELIKQDLAKEQPMYMSIYQETGDGSHAVLIDGMRIKNNNTQVHLGFGWNGDSDGWYDLWKPIDLRSETAPDYYFVGTKRRFISITPLEGEELANWKPYSLTDEQKAAVAAETRQVPEVVSGVLYIPEGTACIADSAYMDRSDIVSVVLPSTIRVIGKLAFSGCSKLSSITLPASVETIKAEAFANCTSLQTVEVNATELQSTSSTVFKGCEAIRNVIFGSTVKVSPKNLFRVQTTPLATVTIPSNMRNVGYALFYESNVTNVVIQEGVESIDDFAFGKCDTLSVIEVPASVTTIGKSAIPKTASIKCPVGSYAELWAAENNYKLVTTPSISADGVLTIPDGTLAIGLEAYRGNTSIKSVVIPNSVEVIGKNSFRGCVNLTEVVIPSSVREMKWAAFYQSGLKKVTVENGLKVMEGFVFDDCDSLKNITLPASIDSIGESGVDKRAFVTCPAHSYADTWAIQNGNLTSTNFSIVDNVLTVGEGVTQIPQNAFRNATFTAVNFPSTLKSIGKYAFMNCANLTEVTIPVSVDTLSQQAFANCTGLQKVNFNAANCTYAGANNGRSAFAGCTALSEVVFGSGVKSIPEQVFRECKALHSVTIPGNVETLNKSNFYSSGLKSVVLSEGVKTINESVFGSCDSMVAITIPASVDFIDAKAFNGVPKTAKISCPVGSYAEQWARENGYLTTHDYAIDNGSLTFAEGVSKIPNSYFAGNADITSVEIPYEIDMINQAAFKNCANLQTVYYNAVRSTNNSNGSNSAFYNCPNLTKVVVGEGVETIPPQLFEQCTALKTIEIPASVTQINNKPFPTTATIICPADSYAERWARQKGYNVVLLDSEISHTESVLSLQIYAKDGFIGGSGDIRIFNLLGQDVTHLNGSLRGVYIVKIGYAVEKVIVE